MSQWPPKKLIAIAGTDGKFWFVYARVERVTDGRLRIYDVPGRGKTLEEAIEEFKESIVAQFGRPIPFKIYLVKEIMEEPLRIILDYDKITKSILAPSAYTP